MANYNVAGVYNERDNVQGAQVNNSTSTAGVVGLTERGGLEPVAIRSLIQYDNIFGSTDNDVRAVVENFFINGGGLIYVSRILPINAIGEVDGTKAEVASLNGTVTYKLDDVETTISLQDMYSAEAKDYGLYFNDLNVQVLNFREGIDTKGAVTIKCDIKIIKDGKPIEAIENVDVFNIQDVFSDFVVFLPLEVKNAGEGVITDIAGTEGVATLTGATLEVNKEPLGSKEYGTGLYSFSRDVRMFSIAGSQEYEEAKAFAEESSIMFIPDSPRGLSSKQALKWAKDTFRLTNNVYPVVGAWVIDAKHKVRPFSGYFMGLMAQVETQHGVQETVAGVNYPLKNAIGLETEYSFVEIGNLYDENVNTLRIQPEGVCVWGGRLLGTSKYLNAERIAQYIEYALYNNTRNLVFKNNNDTLWKAITDRALMIFQDLFRKGAFRATETDEAYYFNVGAGITMTDDDIAKGKVITSWGIATSKPAEFIIHRNTRLA